MEGKKLFLTGLLFCFICLVKGVKGNSLPTKLFVFGDSYADVGSDDKDAVSWHAPYGMTYPGQPAGRYSDGYVMTDFVALFFGFQTPVHYSTQNSTNFTAGSVQDGMNFAYGGTGVFETLSPNPSMGDQIDAFAQLIDAGVFNASDLPNTTALVSLTGADYVTYLATGGTAQGLMPYMRIVVTQLAQNLDRIYNLGIGQVFVTSLPPLGCLPRNTASSRFQTCDQSLNSKSSFHNFWLDQAVSKLNARYSQDYESLPFIIMDLFDAFMVFFQLQDQNSTLPVGLSFNNPILEPCCLGVDENSSCGSVDDYGNQLYTVCSNTSSAFFWDTDHVTHAGWEALFMALQDTPSYRSHHLKLKN